MSFLQQVPNVDVFVPNLKMLIKKYSGTSSHISQGRLIRIVSDSETNAQFFKVKAKLIHKEKDAESFSALAKCISSRGASEAKKDMFKKEIAFYSEVVPELQKFVKESQFDEGFDLFPKLYAARYNLEDKGNNVDDDAALLIEYLIDDGYNILDRRVGVGLDTAKLIIKDLALFHAVPLAIKLTKPNLFEKIKKHLNVPLFEDFDAPKEGCHADLFQILDQYESIKPYMPSVRPIIKNWLNIVPRQILEPAREPFATIRHNELWTNNTLQKFEDGKAIANKFIDFQTYFYDSPLADLVFFVWSSLKMPSAVEHFEGLIELYQQLLLSFLARFGCDTAPFIGQRFDEELKHAAIRVFIPLFMSIINIYGNMDSGSERVPPRFQPICKWSVDIKGDMVSLAARERLVNLIEEFGKRGWIPDIHLMMDAVTVGLVADGPFWVVK